MIPGAEFYDIRYLSLEQVILRFNAFQGPFFSLKNHVLTGAFDHVCC